jgi:hypothetical protein
MKNRDELFNLKKRFTCLEATSQGKDDLQGTQKSNDDSSG